MSHSSEFHKILAQMGELHDKKNADYGSDTDSLSNFRMSERVGISAWVGAFLRSGDKRARIETFINKGTLENEGVEDTFLDYAVYIILCLILFREQQSEKGGYDTKRHVSELSDAELLAQMDQARAESRRNH